MLATFLVLFSLTLSTWLCCWMDEEAGFLLLDKLAECVCQLSLVTKKVENSNHSCIKELEGAVLIVFWFPFFSWLLGVSTQEKYSTYLIGKQFLEHYCVVFLQLLSTQSLTGLWISFRVPDFSNNCTFPLDCLILFWSCSSKRCNWSGVKFKTIMYLPSPPIVK